MALSSRALTVLAWLEGRGAVSLSEWVKHTGSDVREELRRAGCVKIISAKETSMGEAIVEPVETEYSYLPGAQR